MRKLTIWANKHGSYDVELKEDGTVTSASTCIPTMAEVHLWNYEHNITLYEWLSALTNLDLFKHLFKKYQLSKIEAIRLLLEKEMVCTDPHCSFCEVIDEIEKIVKGSDV